MVNAVALLPTPVIPRNPPALVSAGQSFPGSHFERWAKGPAAEQRIRQLRKVFGQSVRTRTVNDVRKLWNEPGADRVTVLLTEITYCVPKGATIPAFILEAA